MSQFKPIPGFDSLKWKAEVQAEILRETEGMTREEVREYFRQAAEQGNARRAEREKRIASGDTTVPTFTLR
jgi:hypothetical protein